jgi:ABC-2 type transport system ATP-binding protein
MIESFELTKRFDTFTAVQAVSLTVQPGEVLALLGPNGAGKTTTIRMLASILKPTSGSARIAGYDISEDSIQVRALVGLLTEHHGLYTRMRAYEYLDFFGRVYNLTPEETRIRAGELMRRFDLADGEDLRLGQYSKGMRQKLALVRALLHEPRVLLLDEPTSAMDPSSAHLVRESIRKMRGEQRTIIVCTHNLHEAEALADKIAIIRRGEIVVQDETRKLKQNLLGDPVMELRLAGSLDGALQQLPPSVSVISKGDRWLRYSTSDPDRTNPDVLRNLMQAGIEVVTLSEIERSLEDVYLQVVDAPESQGEAVV